MSCDSQNSIGTEQKKNILISAREKNQLIYKGWPIRMTDFSVETIKVIRDWTNVLQVMENHRYQPSLLCPVKLSVIIERQRISFHDKNR